METMKRRYANLFWIVIVLAVVAVLVTRLLGPPEGTVGNEAGATVRETEASAGEVRPGAAGSSAGGSGASGAEVERPANGSAASESELERTADGSASQSPAPSGTSAPMLTLSLSGGAVTLHYPAGMSLATAEDEVRASSTIPPCDDGFEYCLYVPQTSYENTNFRVAGMAIRPRPELGAPISCLLTQPPGFVGLQPGLAVDQDGSGSLSTARFGDLTDGAAGTYATGEARRLWAGGACYDFTVRVVESQFGNYPAGSIEEFTDADRRAVLGEFLDVLDGLSVRLEGDARFVTWPAAGESNLAPFITLGTPTPGATVSSPLRFEGEAVGPWFFEGTFPVSVVAEDGTVLGRGFATAQGPWMVTDKVQFQGEVAFEAAGATRATLVLERDDPSAVMEQVAALHVALNLQR